MLFRYIFTIDFKIICYICPQNHQWKNGETWNNEYIGCKTNSFGVTH